MHALVELKVLLDLLALNTHDRHEVVCWVAQFGAAVLRAKGTEVVNSEFSLVEVDNLALSEEHQSVEVFENVGVWLMNSTYHSSAASRQLSQGVTDRRGCKGVEASGGLIKEDEVGIGYQLDADGTAFALSTRDTLDKWPTNLCVLALVKSELMNDFVNTFALLLFTTLELELCREVEALPDRHRLEENVVLLYVSREGGEVGVHLLFVDSIDQDLALLVEVLADLSA